MRVNETTAQCPFCFETIDLFIDTSAGAQNYVEDCPVCCRPFEVVFDVAYDASGLDDGIASVTLNRAD